MNTNKKTEEKNRAEVACFATYMYRPSSFDLRPRTMNLRRTTSKAGRKYFRSKIDKSHWHKHHKNFDRILLGICPPHKLCRSTPRRSLHGTGQECRASRFCRGWHCPEQRNGLLWRQSNPCWWTKLCKMYRFSLWSVETGPMGIRGRLPVTRGQFARRKTPPGKPVCTAVEVPSLHRPVERHPYLVDELFGKSFQRLIRLQTDNNSFV